MRKQRALKAGLTFFHILCAIVRGHYCEIEIFIVKIKNMDNKFKNFLGKGQKCTKKECDAR